MAGPKGYSGGDPQFSRQLRAEGRYLMNNLNNPADGARAGRMVRTRFARGNYGSVREATNSVLRDLNG